MSKHTPGPWTYTKFDEGYFVIDCDDDGDQLAECYIEADACLIAAAPDLLEVLKLVLEVGLADENGSEAVQDTIHAVIAKAEGRT